MEPGYDTRGFLEICKDAFDHPEKYAKSRPNIKHNEKLPHESRLRIRPVAAAVIVALQYYPLYFPYKGKGDDDPVR